MRFYILNEDGEVEEVTHTIWREWLQHSAPEYIRKTVIDDDSTGETVTIYTSFVGIQAPLSPWRPGENLFVTVVRVGDEFDDRNAARSDTVAEAKAQHERYVDAELERIGRACGRRY
jgi:hypothetical protein